ncbi:TRAP transporter small permease [bacterium]|nr:TRAP transporter small permease [candidate division CSSED10-310 bacterium]
MNTQRKLSSKREILGPNSMIARIARIIRHIENTSICILLGLLIVLSVAQVTGRLLFHSGLAEADPLIYYMVLWLGLSGAVIATRENEHITIDIISRFVSGRPLGVIRALTHAFAAGICLYLTWIGIRFLQDEIRYDDTMIMGIPLWLFQLIIPVSFGMMGIRFAVHAVQQGMHPSSYGVSGDGDPCL